MSMLRGRGRPRLLDATQVHYARRQYKAGVTISELARQLRVARDTVRRAILGDR